LTSEQLLLKMELPLQVAQLLIAEQLSFAGFKAV
jgi:hypothetical protein